MGGAIGMTQVGAIYQVTDPEEPDVTIVRYLDQWHVCRRDQANPKVKEIVADTNDHLLAQMVAHELQRLLSAGGVREHVVSRPPKPRRKRR